MNENQAMMLERSMRSVFVGNIPFDLTEERLKEIFSEVGPVLSFKLVYDRENGKPKGYGFCEYKDIETANSAMRNLNGYEIAGRMLKVDNAANEKSRMELQNSIMDREMPQEAPYDNMDPGRVPEAISKAVASLPPEQMFELMRQMKQCIQNNPHEARTMLLQNPQLAYSLLQSLVVMKIVDPEIALTMLSKPNQVPDLMNPDRPFQPPPIKPEFLPQMNRNMGPNDMGMPPMGMPMGMGPQMPMNNMGPQMGLNNMGPPMGMNNMGPQMGMNNAPPLMGMNPSMPPMNPMGMGNEMERPMDPRGRNMGGGPMGDVDLRTMPMSVPTPVMPPLPNDQGMRDPRQPPLPVAPPRDPRGSDPRAGASVPPAQPPLPRQPPLPKAPASQPMNMMGDGSDQDTKAQLIKQVLQLTPEQIAMLPADQRNSILLLKEQIAKSTQR